MSSIDASAWDDRFRQRYGGREPHLVASVLVPYVGARVRYGERGLLIVALAVRCSTERPLVVIWDGPDNPGASATNAMHTLLAWTAAFWPLYPVREAQLLQRDSDGCYDEVLVKWSGDPPKPLHLSWRPVLALGGAPRSWEAVQAMLGNARAADIETAVVRGPAA